MIDTIETKVTQPEVWKTIEGYEHYEVSSWGNVRKLGSSNYLKMCNGYGMRRVALRYKDEFRLVVIAKLVLEAFVCKQPDGHKPFCLDGNYEHLYVENLQWVVRRRKHYKHSR